MGVFGEVGAYYSGNPKVSLASNNDALIGSDGRTLGQTLDDQERKIANDDKYKWLPVGKVGVNFYW